MTVTKSFFLNFIRWVSALFVVAGHTKMLNDYYFKNSSFNSFYDFFCHYDHAAVMIFFVLSGYLIFYTSRRYEKDSIGAVKRYFTDRFSRIYSMLIPALLLTIVLDFVCKLWFGQLYIQNIPQDKYFFRLMWNALSMQGTWGSRVQFASNPALWSIGYEFSFYLIFSVFIYKREAFATNLLCLSIIVVFFLIKGPQIFIYFFLWLLGCLACALSTKYQIKIKPVWMACLLLAFFAVKNVIYQPTVLFNNPYVQDAVYSLLFAGILMTDIKLPALKSPLYAKSRDLAVKVNNLLAGISFTMYATHLPVLYLVYAFLYTYANALTVAAPAVVSLALIGFSIVFAYWFSFISEKKNQWLKSRLVSTPPRYAVE